MGIKYNSGVSAQLKSAVMLAGLNSDGLTSIIEKKKQDHTENILIRSLSNKNKKREREKDYNNWKKYLNPINFKVPGDPSSAAFFTALTLLNKNSFLKIKNVGLNQLELVFTNY